MRKISRHLFGSVFLAFSLLGEQFAAAEAFVNHLLSPESRTLMASIAGTIPANPKAPVPDKLKAVLPGLPVPNVYNVDWLEVDKHYSDWQDTWAREIQAH
jgi:ABC-type thiamine transport system substrate-binding protein